MNLPIYSLGLVAAFALSFGAVYVFTGDHSAARAEADVMAGSWALGEKKCDSPTRTVFADGTITLEAPPLLSVTWGTGYQTSVNGDRVELSYANSSSEQVSWVFRRVDKDHYQLISDNGKSIDPNARDRANFYRC